MQSGSRCIVIPCHHAYMLHMTSCYACMHAASIGTTGTKGQYMCAQCVCLELNWPAPMACFTVPGCQLEIHLIHNLGHSNPFGLPPHSLVLIRFICLALVATSACTLHFLQSGRHGIIPHAYNIKMGMNAEACIASMLIQSCDFLLCTMLSDAVVRSCNQPGPAAKACMMM